MMDYFSMKLAYVREYPLTQCDNWQGKTTIITELRDLPAKFLIKCHFTM